MQQQQNRSHRFILPGKGRGFNGYLSRAQFSHRPGIQKTDCFICLEEIAKNEHLSFDMPCCGHVIHLTCWEKWEAEKRDISTPSCPMCRSIWSRGVGSFEKLGGQALRGTFFFFFLPPPRRQKNFGQCTMLGVHTKKFFRK